MNHTYAKQDLDGISMPNTKYTFPWLGDIVVSASDIHQAITRLAAQIDRDYADLSDEPLVVIGVLRGAFIFMADLVRALQIPVQVDFLTVSSYGDATQSSLHHQLLTKPQLSLAHRHVLIVDDILDTGLTPMFLDKVLRLENPASLNYCMLLNKIGRRHSDFNLNIKYLGPEVPNVYLIGYGLDNAGQDRHLPDIHQLKTSSPI